MTVNGYVGGPNGELDWMTWVWDDKLKNYVQELTDSSDTILLGRKMTDGFIAHWTNIVKNKPEDESFEFAKIMVNTPKVVFSRTLKECKWDNTTLASELTSEVCELKQQKGRDIVVYGGAAFVSSLIKEGLIDEYHIFINPSTIPAGLTIFGATNGKVDLPLTKATQFDCGIVVLQYNK